MTGPEPRGSGPVRRPDVEAARRALYARGRRVGAVEAYERLAAEAAPAAPLPPVPTVRSLRALPRLLLVAAVGTLITAALAFPPIPPDFLPPPPEVPGATLIAYSRQHVPGTGPGIISYQPSGYRVYPPRPAGIRVDLSCAGTGRVLISADARFTFDCTRSTRTLTQTKRTAGRTPFVIVGTTYGDVVWSVRVTALPTPAKRFSCSIDAASGGSSCSPSPSR